MAFAKIEGFGSACFSTVRPASLSSVPSTFRSAAPAKPALSAAERVLAAELEARGASSGALSMMASSMVQMVQAGKSPQSRWKAS